MTMWRSIAHRGRVAVKPGERASHKGTYLPSQGINTVDEVPDSNWFTTSGGATPARVPLPQDTATFDANSVTSAGVTITLDSAMARISGMDWTSVTNTPNLDFGASLNYFGNIVLSSGMSVSNVGNFTVDGAGSNITTAGVTWTAPIKVDCGCIRTSPHIPGKVFIRSCVDAEPGANQVTDRFRFKLLSDL